MSKYLRLFIPAVEWILQCLAHKGTEVRKGGHGCIRWTWANIQFDVLCLSLSLLIESIGRGD